MVEEKLYCRWKGEHSQRHLGESRADMSNRLNKNMRREGREKRGARSGSQEFKRQKNKRTGVAKMAGLYMEENIQYKRTYTWEKDSPAPELEASG